MTNPESVSELLRSQESGERSAAEITRAALDAVAATQPVIRAFTHVAERQALDAAEQIDARRRRGETLGPLAGIPVAVKDVICTRDMPTTCASRMLQGYVPPYDATVTRRLRAADAVLIGKTNMDEFAMGASTETSAFGVTRNPWDVDRTPGGSSGGAAACVAAGTVPLSLGSDTGGSIRQPAAFCGVTGLKPTYGRVSRYGLVAFASSLDQIGPLAWSVDDAARLLQVIAGFDPSDATCLERPVPDYLATADRPGGSTGLTGGESPPPETLEGLKIGVVRDGLDQDGVAPAVRQRLDQAVRVFAEAGAEIVDVRLPHSRYWVPTYYVIAPCEASSNLSRYDGAHYGHRAAELDAAAAEGPLGSMYRRSREQGFGAEVKRRIMVGTYALSAGYVGRYYHQALKVRRLIRGDFDAAFAQADLLLGPVTPTPAFRLGEKLDDPIQMYLCDLFTVGANLAGLPALSLPAGQDPDGLPVAIQLQAPPLEEPRLIRAGRVFQARTDHHRRRPAAITGAGS